jgi:phosphoribosyl-ATP pyrophosphohydrolase/phosphoribosyl-AMP cyclohydrolase
MFDYRTTLMSNDITFLLRLEEIIRDRMSNPSAASYTSQLVAAGDKKIAQKLGEEGVELALAAVAGDTDEQLNEAADLVFHLLVLLQQKGLSLGAVSSRLEQRHNHDVGAASSRN